jgi:hypothetical protein
MGLHNLSSARFAKRVLAPVAFPIWYWKKVTAIDTGASIHPTNSQLSQQCYSGRHAEQTSDAPSTAVRVAQNKQWKQGQRMNQSGTPRRSTSGSSSERSSPRRQMSRAEDPQTSRKEMSREATAYHEAGHAVAAWKRGIRPIIVSIAAGE